MTAAHNEANQQEWIMKETLVNKGTLWDSLDPEVPPPWVHEPDVAVWTHAPSELPCVAVRVPHMGHWRGWVGVLPGHPLHGGEITDEAARALRVHQGLHSSGSWEVLGVDAPPGVKLHIPAVAWWFTVDFGGAGDLKPGYPAWVRAHQLTPAVEHGEYRTLDYVRDELDQLAQQLVEGREER